MKEKTILLVEDNPDDAALTLRAFQKNGILNPITLARDGREALDYLFGTGAYEGRDTTQQPVVTLLDLKLPRIDGLEVLQQIRQNDATRLLPVVILTSSSEDRDKIDGYRLGANSYIRKPVDFDKFIDAVRLLGLYWLLWNEPPPVKPSREQLGTARTSGQTGDPAQNPCNPNKEAQPCDPCLST